MNQKDENSWIMSCRKMVQEYLTQEGINHGRIGEYPAWHVSPYVSIWAIESLKSPGSVGWWVVCGDHPTDYVSAKDIREPRAVLRAIGEKWAEVSKYMLQGKAHPDITIGDPKLWPELGKLLEVRANIFLQWAEDDELWQE